MIDTYEDEEAEIAPESEEQDIENEILLPESQVTTENISNQEIESE